ncbi:hypothetical protein [Hufsiella ginkgonis]|uniref:Uncharacterized protein n=1 Tax=Hufsiella ginkgonis TaxID=2695274 RepID=A0A7K1XT04_9SPHI|nr:hypothetical protein [Hufsiella ginkgonis]MXV14050.1 hypothetical protein [Hufsiella ginkgonis]
MKPAIRTLISLAALIAIALVCYLVFYPAKINRENSVKVEGIVALVGQDSLKDIYITLEGRTGSLLINSGVTQGLSPDSLRARLMGKKVEILYLRPHWLSGLTPSMSPTRYITEIKQADEVIYTEIR